MTDEPEIAPLPTCWYVAFYDGARRWPWEFALSTGFRHVSAFTYYPQVAAWAHYDVTFDHTAIRLMDTDAFVAWLDSLPSHRIVLKWEPDDDVRTPALWRKLFFWCAPAVAHLVRAPSRALRPEALYRDLVRQGAQEAFPNDQG